MLTPAFNEMVPGHQRLLRWGQCVPLWAPLALADFVPITLKRSLCGISVGSSSAPAPATRCKYADGRNVRMYRESPDAMKRFLDHLADHAETEFPIHVMANAISVTPKSMKGVLGAFGHRVHSRYRWESWPIEKRWDHDQGMNFYNMSRAVADMIRSAR